MSRSKYPPRHEAAMGEVVRYGPLAALLWLAYAEAFKAWDWIGPLLVFMAAFVVVGRKRAGVGLVTAVSVCFLLDRRAEIVMYCIALFAGCAGFFVGDQSSPQEADATPPHSHETSS